MLRSPLQPLLRSPISLITDAIRRAFPWSSLFTNNTPGFRINIEEAIRLNQQALGPELVSNGTFTDGLNGWADVSGDGSASVSGGVLTITEGSSREERRQAVTVQAGKTYVVSASLGGSLPIIFLGSAPGSADYGNIQPSTGPRFITATTNVLGVRLQTLNTLGSGLSATFSRISVREIDLSKCVAFQDSAGTLPVVSMEQPLGLILDKKLGVPVLGSQLVTNGGFDADTAWTKGTGWAIGSGVATKTAGTASTLTPSTAIVPTVGRWYVVEYTITRTAGSLAVSIGAGTGAAKTASGTYREILCASTTGNLTFSADATFAGTVDSVSVRELPGNHFVQPSNTASRPIVSRRVNLLTATEAFGDAAWIASNGTVSANTVAAPTGAMTADVFTENTSTAVHNVYAGATNRPSIPAGSPIEVSFYIGRGTRRYVSLYAGSGGNGLNAVVDTTDFTITTARAIGAGYTLTASSVTPVGPDWCRVSFSGVCTSAITYIVSVSSTNSATPAIAETSFTGEAQTIRVWGADLRLSVDNNLPYQRVTSSTDYDESGFPAYARFDGLDDWLETGGTVDMTSTDAVTVLSGVTKLSDAAIGTVFESSVSSSTNNGCIWLAAPREPAPLTGFGFRSKGTVASEVGTATGTSPAPATRLLTGIGKISTDTAILRVNGAQAASSSADQGTGNYGAHKFYMGRRAGSSLPFNGRIYGVTVIGKLLDDSTLARAEQAERQMGRLY